MHTASHHRSLGVALPFALVLALAPIAWAITPPSRPQLSPKATTESSSTSSGSSDSSAVTAAETISAALIGGFFAWLVGKQARDQADRTTAQAVQVIADAQLRDSRHRAANDVRAATDLGAELDRAVDGIRKAPTDPDRRFAVADVSARLAARAEFVWDAELKGHIQAYAERASRLADAVLPADRERLTNEAAHAWKNARARSGVLWRALMFSAVDGNALLVAAAPPIVTGTAPVPVPNPHVVGAL